jgi:hypothetical protein
MDVRCKLEPRVVKQCHQGCRLEEELWKLAYEQVCPQIRRFSPTLGTRERRAETRRLAAGRT